MEENSCSGIFIIQEISFLYNKNLWRVNNLFIPKHFIIFPINKS